MEVRLAAKALRFSHYIESSDNRETFINFKFFHARVFSAKIKKEKREILILIYAERFAFEFQCCFIFHS